MKNKKLIISTTIALGIMSMSAKVTHFDYSNYEFNYTDGGIEKTAKLTDEATTTSHMIALLKAVYTDPTIPGTWWGYDYNDTQLRQLNYDDYANRGTPWGKGSEIYSNPDEDGMTLLLVQMKDGWYSTHPSRSNVNTYFDNAYSSIKLVDCFTRVNDPENPGYLFSIDGATSKFFFIAKGKARPTYYKPLFRLFEQISPVNTNAGSTPTYNFIDEMKAGNSYLCYHDCGDVGTVGNGHWFTISSDGEAYSLKNLTIFIPDRRLEYNTVGSSQDYFCYYGNSYRDNPTYPELMPKVLMYTADLEAKGRPSESEGYYRVYLNWSSSFTKEKLGVEVPQHFYVYIVNDDGTRTLFQKVTKDDNGMVRVQDYDYLVQQTADPQLISYVITAQPINYDNDGSILRDNDGSPLVTLSAESPVRTVVIPGRNPFMTQAQEFRSRYEIVDKDEQYNVYKNSLLVYPNTEGDYIALRNNTNPYNVVRVDANGKKEVIATIQYKLAEDNENAYEYIVNYNASTQDTNLLFDNEQPATGGKLVDYMNSDITIIDRFTASTVNNDHSSKYDYYIMQGELGNESVFSNTFTVPVCKTTNIVNGEGHTLQEVKTDVDHNAKATPNNEISFNAMFVKAMNLVNYEIRRLNQVDFKQYTKIGKAENFNNSGEYYIYALSEEGTLDQLIEKVKVDAEGGKLTSVDINCSSSEKVSSYVPVINTLFNGYPDKPNSYGCDIKDIEYPVLKLSASDMAKTAPFAGEGGQYMAYKVGLSLTPELNSLKNVFYYRIWRVVDGKTTLINETLLNNLEDKSQPDPSGGELWGTKYYKIKYFFPGNNPIYGIDDIFIDYALNGDSKNVTYIARLYATSLDEDDVPATLLASANGKDYFIAQDIITVTFNGGTPTGIDAIDSDNMVESVTYYNAMGHPSNRPHAGINIVETRYSNGTRKIEKIVK